MNWWALYVSLCGSAALPLGIACLALQHEEVPRWLSLKLLGVVQIFIGTAVMISRAIDAGMGS